MQNKHLLISFLKLTLFMELLVNPGRGNANSRLKPKRRRSKQPNSLGVDRTHSLLCPRSHRKLFQYGMSHLACGYEPSGRFSFVGTSIIVAPGKGVWSKSCLVCAFAVLRFDSSEIRFPFPSGLCYRGPSY